MVYFHGGAFSSGTSNEIETYGARLSRRGDVVVVTVNHRLNAFGYLYLAEFGGPDLADSGNVGMLDLVLALQWVRDQASEFGGDAGNVTSWPPRCQVRHADGHAGGEGFVSPGRDAQWPADHRERDHGATTNARAH
jgi:hypothetical protein